MNSHRISSFPLRAPLSSADVEMESFHALMRPSKSRFNIISASPAKPDFSLEILSLVFISRDVKSACELFFLACRRSFSFEVRASCEVCSFHLRFVYFGVGWSQPSEHERVRSLEESFTLRNFEEIRKNKKKVPEQLIRVSKIGSGRNPLQSL